VEKTYHFGGERKARGCEDEFLLLIEKEEGKALLRVRFLLNARSRESARKGRKASALF